MIMHVARRCFVAFAALSIAAVHAASLAPIGAEHGMVVTAQHLAVEHTPMTNYPRFDQAVFPQVPSAPRPISVGRPLGGEPIVDKAELKDVIADFEGSAGDRVRTSPRSLSPRLEPMRTR